jgi:SPP1 gp7 family putative phage head morphogenesis protein
MNSMAKSPLTNSLSALRKRMEREHTSELKRSISRFLDDQRLDIANRLRVNGDAFVRKPKDPSSWFPQQRWDRELAKILERPLVAMAQNVNQAINRTIPVKAAPAGVIDRALKRGAARVTKINQRTRDSVQDFLVEGLREGLTATELADKIESGVILSNGQPAFDEYRAELIARTELMDAYNSSAIASYEDAGVTEVQAIDGDQDEECAARDGQVFSVEEAMQIEDHPNGTLDWVPVIDYEALREALGTEPVKAAPIREVQPIQVFIENKIPVPMHSTIERDEFGKATGVREEYANG